MNILYKFIDNMFQTAIFFSLSSSFYTILKCNLLSNDANNNRQVLSFYLVHNKKALKCLDMQYQIM